MFHQGDLSSGIQTALQQSKSVVCFVRDNEDESSKWQDEYLTADELNAPLSEKAVVLRLLAGTQEANYLSAMTPITTSPTVIVISNGAIKEYITSGVSKEVFVSRLSAAIGGSTAPLSPHQHAAETSTPLQTDEIVTMTVEDHNADGTTTVVSEQSVAPTAVQGILQNMEADASFTRNESPDTERAALATADAQQNQSTAVEEDAHPAESQTRQPYIFSPPQQPAVPSPETSGALADRQIHDEANKAANEQAQKDERTAAAGRRNASFHATDPKRVAEIKYATEAAKKRQQERAERERILKQIEDNRAEQKARAEKARLARETAQQKISGHPARASMSGAGSNVRRGDTCALQIRLFDGSTIRKTFSSKNTLGKEVRAWIDAEQQIAGSPYTFKQIIAPQPSKTISAGEEEETLQELGLVPNATLVLVPIRSYNSAYESSPGVTGLATGIVSGAALASLGIVGGALGLVGSGLGWGARALGSVLGGGSGGDAAGRNGVPDRSQSRPQQPYSDREREGNQFYNGNSTNTEPRKKEDESRKRD